MVQTEPAFLPLDDFWSVFVKATTAGRAPPLEPQAITGFLALMFGRLTEHRLRLGAPFPAVFDCRACRNNQGLRNDAACRTHVGVVRGLFESAIFSPLDVTYDPHADGSCTVTVNRAHAPNGLPLMPEARLKQGIVIMTDTSGALIHDSARGLWMRTAPEAAAVLSHLGEGTQAAPLARRLGISEVIVIGVLGEAWLHGWIECRFTPEETPT